jgi:hypothetical protein
VVERHIREAHVFRVGSWVEVYTSAGWRRGRIRDLFIDESFLPIIEVAIRDDEETWRVTVREPDTLWSMLRYPERE